MLYVLGGKPSMHKSFEGFNNVLQYRYWMIIIAEGLITRFKQ